ncbi:hypothetical protein B0A55_06280 [Friedmanniomyces simplex]|uniref:Formin GTPase-binding domain-containing protein n=1 Tax=Friedmanniomyces simplex TaxID=329884 RepID=A0A4U0X9G1_9PEZI|nr:hypothetical protein B0A55_06280 [Friedmanniomyces simplex]
MEATTGPRPGHKRNASSKSNLLRAFVSSKSKATPPGDNQPAMRHRSIPFLPPDHPHAGKARVLGERQGNVQSPPSSPSKQQRSVPAPKTSKTGTSSKVKVKTMDGSTSPKKSRSSTNLSAMFAKMNRSSKDLSAVVQKDKENATPPSSSGGQSDTPIWAQFASPDKGKPSSRPSTRDSKSSHNLADEIARYTPRDYSPSKQRNFNGSLDQPSTRPTLNSRPKSAYVLPNEGWAEAIGRRVSGQRASIEGRLSDETQRRESQEQHRRVSGERPVLLKRSHTERKVSGSSGEQAVGKEKLNVLKRGSRVMTAVAAFQGKGKGDQTAAPEPGLDPKAVDDAFEAVLHSRQIPEPMRQKMRSLTLRVKADFIKQDLGSKNAGKGPDGSLTSGGKDGAQSPEDARKRDSPDDRRSREEDAKSTKRSRSRPRSRTFTFSKGDKRGDTSPTKERSKSKSRPTSIHIPSDNTAISPTTGTPKSPFGSLGRKPAVSAIPADYIKYLQSNRDPTKIEVGRLHKLRILLRNETVAWVDSFLALGGMTEIVGLLHRIMGLEWREEHEDQLFHETLLCLKGLCTTERAMEELAKVADELFPALLGMLFDEEKKGPAEYGTRTVIVNVLFNFLASAANSSTETLEERARRILSYLGEPQKAEDERPVDFVLDMRTPRPYRLWCREVTNVTREVFWIFLHHLNVVSLPKHNKDEASAIDCATDEERARTLNATYTLRHFPGSRAPVPAAPYIGGVEWDATTYITSHLDLLNGLLASLPTCPARNALRADLRASGFEKTMGATLRTCKEKFYSGVHDGLRAWVGAASEDGWGTGFVREGPTDEERVEKHRARSASPKKKREEGPPRLEEVRVEALPALELDLGGGGGGAGGDEGWLE